MYRKVHMFDVEIDGRSYNESDVEQAGEEIVLSETADGVELGLSICYDLRFPELFRILAVRGARVIALPSAFTLPTTRDHWETLIRASAIENQTFVIAANQVGRHPGRSSLRWALDDRRPVGHRVGAGTRPRWLHRRGARPGEPARYPRAAAVAGQPAAGGLPLAGGHAEARQ